jgi:transcriptional regulator with GAF, ATPase, and Fis domain
MTQEQREQIIKFFKKNKYSLVKTAKEFNRTPENISQMISRYMIPKANKLTGTFKRKKKLA